MSRSVAIAVIVIGIYDLNSCLLESYSCGGRASVEKISMLLRLQSLASLTAIDGVS